MAFRVWFVLILSAQMILSGCNREQVAEDSDFRQIEAIFPQQSGKYSQREIDRLLDILFALPEVKTAPGISVEVLIPPGQIYDPLWMDYHDDGRIWVSDDGLEVGEKFGSMVISFDTDGSNIIWEMGPDQTSPSVDHALAPEGWGKYGGMILLTSQPSQGLEGFMKQHTVKAVMPRSKVPAEVVCTLPSNAHGEASMSSEMRFGPGGSDFEGLWLVMNGNRAIYHIGSDGVCEEFVSIPEDLPLAIGFSPDGSKMLLAVRVAERNRLNNSEPLSKIIFINRDGMIEDEGLLVPGVTLLHSFAYAPKEWGALAGQIFLTARGPSELQQMTRVVSSDGKVYRIDEDGQIQLVAEGFRNPVGILFHGKDLYISDVNAEFMAIKNGRELPDGIIWKLAVEQ